MSDDGVLWRIKDPEAFITEIKQSEYPFATTNKVKELMRGDIVFPRYWKYIRQIKKETISIEEAEKRLNVKIERS